MGARLASVALPWWQDHRLRVLVADEDPAAHGGGWDGGSEAEVALCADGAEALWQAGRADPAVVVLSATLPVVEAAVVAAVLAGHREGHRTVVVGVGPGEADRAVPVLAAGADGVISRPYRTRELADLVRRHLTNRDEERQRTRVLTAGPLRLDGPAFEASADGRHLPLSLREFEILGLLMLGAGKVVPVERIRRELSEARGEAISVDTVSVHIRRLRKHLAGAAGIDTVRGVGYRLSVPGQVGDIRRRGAS